MSGVKGDKPHKKPHKGCIGWIYCKRLDKTFDIGDQANIPDKRGYSCDCGRYTRLDPFNHTINYYDEDIVGIDYDDMLKLTPEIVNSFPTMDIKIIYWEKPNDKPKELWVKVKILREINEMGLENKWYCWNAFNKKNNQILASLKGEI